MRAEVVAVGTELLLGDIANTNAQEIGAMLAGIGVDCHIHTAVGDNEERIARAIVDALGRAEAIVVTGGLGPTHDDVTREAIARATGQRLVRDPVSEARLRAIFERIGRPMAEINVRQADRPAHATPIETRIGTAPGLIVEHDGGVIYAVPGVPAEMREMMARAVLPDLARRAGATAVTHARVVRVSGVAESAIAETLAPLWRSLEDGPVKMAYLAGGGEVRVRLTAKAGDAAGADALLDPVERRVREAMGAAVVGGGDETLEVVVGALLRRRGASVAVAESATGGGVSERITRVAGSSEYYVGGVVAYSAAAKSSLLGVDASAIRREGAVSEVVARAMARGARERFGADVGVGLTGAAGPDVHGGAEPGVVWIAVDGFGRSAARTVRFAGDRAAVRGAAAAAALNLLRLFLTEEVS
ncbi:MAG TPA: competence/damage-inducible protein A [Actinomycetota bacterium]